MTKKDREAIANFMKRTDERLRDLSSDVFKAKMDFPCESTVRIYAREEIQAYVGWWTSLAGRAFLWCMAFVGAVVVVRAIISCMR